MSIQTSKLKSTLYYFFALLIIYLPFQRLLEQILLHCGLSESLTFWSTRWYEPIIIIVILLNCCIAIKSKFRHSRLDRESTNSLSVDPRRNLSRALTRDGDDRNVVKTILVIVSALVVLSIVSIFVLSHSLSRGIEGFRFTIFFLLTFLTAYSSRLDQKQSDKLINIYLIMAGIFALWGIAERFLPINYLATWGLISSDSGFGYGVHKVVTVYQSVTGIGGPNQLASYLLPAIFIAVSPTKLRIKRNYEITNNTNKNTTLQQYNNRTVEQPASPAGGSSNGNLASALYYIVPIISIAAIILTFSRSAWVGLYVGLLVSAIILIKNLWLKITSVIILLAIAGGIGFYYFNKPNDILTHGASDTGHKSAFSTSITEIKNRTSQPALLLFGSGIGTAGPAALKYGDGFVSESWYLQLVLELGVVGLVLWLIFIYYLLAELYRSYCSKPTLRSAENYHDHDVINFSQSSKNKIGLFLALIAVSATAIFLHTFADNPALSITFFLLIGACLQNRR